MLKFLSSFFILLYLFVFYSFAYSQPLGLGRPATYNEVSSWDIDIRPDGKGLPVGSGSVIIGEELYTDNCASCHGDFGEGIDRWPELAGGFDTLDSEDPVKTVGSYWPYLSTVWDYVHRAMPFGNAQSLSNDEVYSITAYIMYLNDLVDEDFELSNLNFEEVRLPNEQNFYQDNREDLENVIYSKRCMKDCKKEAIITKRAVVLDVTKEEEDVGHEEGDDQGDESKSSSESKGKTMPPTNRTQQIPLHRSHKRLIKVIIAYNEYRKTKNSPIMDVWFNVNPEDFNNFKMLEYSIFIKTPRSSRLSSPDPVSSEAMPSQTSHRLTKAEQFKKGMKWIVSIGRFDVQTAVMTLSSFRVTPRRGHLKRLNRIYGYLSKMKHGVIRLRVQEPNLYMTGRNPYMAK